MAAHAAKASTKWRGLRWASTDLILRVSANIWNSNLRFGKEWLTSFQHIHYGVDLITYN
jgi:hypothetical protein